MAFSLFGLGKHQGTASETKNQVVEIPVAAIVPNQYQPRKIFDQTEIQELAQTISEHGLLQPSVVREFRPGEYEIIAGERRFRAVKLLQWEKIPAIVEKMTDAESASLALIENLQRQDLNPIEEAEGYERLMKQFGLTQEQVSKRVVKSRSAVANALRLLALPTEVRTMVSEGEISGGHARAVLAVNEADKRVEAARQMVGLSVRQSEALAKRMNKKTVEKPEQSPEVSVDYIAELEKELEGALGRKISIQQGKHSGQLTLEYYGAEDLERLSEALRNLRV